MNFDLTEEQLLLRALAQRFVEDRYRPDQRRRYLEEPSGFSAANWRQLGELGLIGAAFPAEAGGLGASPVDLIVLFEALAPAMLAEPLIESAVFAGALFEAAAPAELAQAWLPDLVTGSRRLAVGHREQTMRDRAPHISSRAHRDAGGWLIEGDKALVPAATAADGLIVSARIEGGTDVGLFLVSPRAPGLALTPYRLIDGTLAARVTLAGVQLQTNARLDAGLEQLATAEARANLARAAEAVGLMDFLLRETLAHLRQREQFGQPLAKFQALQHRVVRHYVAVEQARSLLYRAAMANGSDKIAQQRAIAGARAFIAEASVALGHEAIQLHGGMGISDEMAITHAHKRLFLLSRHPLPVSAALDEYAGIAA